MKFFGSSDSTAQDPAAAQRAKLTRRSSSLAQLIKSLDSEETLCILDLGSTSPANIRYCTERGHKIYSDDLLISSTDPSLVIKDEAGKPALDSKRFLEENLVYPGGAVRYCAVLEPGRLSGREPGEAGGRAALVAAQAGRHAAGLFSHPGSRPGCALLPLPHRRRRRPGDAAHRSRRRKKRRRPPASSACSACSTTATSKIFSAILLPSSSFSPATTSAKCWSCASPLSLSS